VLIQLENRFLLSQIPVFDLNKELLITADDIFKRYP
jgi:hypothetical protein